MDSFEIVLKNEKVKPNNKIGYLISGTNFIFFIFYSFFVRHGYERVLWLVFALLIPATYFIELSFHKKLTIKKNNISITYCWLVLLWCAVNLWIAVAHIILLVADTIAKRKLLVNFDTNGIEYPTVPKKNIPWDVLSNVILKDGLLTIDFKNNKLLQSEIETTGRQINETAFNHFCRQQIKL
jgi:hypothetical protein